MTISSVVLLAAIVFRAGGAEESLLWGVFAAVLCCGVSTILQALRLGRVGAGYVIFVGTSSTTIAISVTALAEGGPAMLATLVVVSGVVLIALSARLSLLRRVLTPTVTGTVIMLMPVTVMPIMFDMLNRPLPGASAAAGPVSAFVTIAAVIGIGLKGAGTLRLWAPTIGVVAGSLVAGWFDIYDTGRVAGAAWFGLPEGQWPGLDLDFGPAFWALLPGFVFVTLVGTTKSIGTAVAIQRVSWRRPRAVDFRAVQGTVTAEGAGNVLAGLAGTTPNTPYPVSVSLTELTGVAARRVGVAAGASAIVLAFLPKVLALILAIPGPVVAASIMVVMAMLFVTGMREVLQVGADSRTGLIAGVSFWTGAGFQAGMIFPEFFSEFAGGLLRNGMTSGGLMAILLTLLTDLTGPRGSRFRGWLDRDELPRLNEFLGAFAARGGWGADMEGRLQAVSEETLLTLLRRDEEADGVRRPQRPRTAAPASHRPQGGRRRGAGIRGRDRRRRRQPPGPYRVARGAARRRRPDRAGRLTAAAAALRVLDPAPAVPQRGHRDRPGRRRRARRSLSDSDQRQARHEKPRPQGPESTEGSTVPSFSAAPARAGA